MYAEHSAVELGVVTIHRSSFSLERRMREADVGSQSADTIKLGFSSCSNLFGSEGQSRPHAGLAGFRRQGMAHQSAAGGARQIFNRQRSEQIHATAGRGC